ncbi:MAG: LON peptidase substrate-binding domain-containing protein, partial [Bacteroidetes bacterium]|nr:LON peptidase substrate-binding domain-containing protein [Bacteroidota bacterium]
MNIGGFGETEKLIICYTLYRLDPLMENQLLPLFPLQIMLFPGEIAPLYIFEPRYRQLIEDSEKEKITFGILYINNAQLFHIGTEVKLHSVLKKYENGTSDIKIEALNFFRLRDFKKIMPGKLYSGGVTESIEVENKIANTGLKKNYQKFEKLINNQILDDGELDSIKTLDIVKKI